MTEFKFNCPYCKQSLEAPEDMLGQTTDCPACGQTIRIPEPVRNTSPTPPTTHRYESSTKSCPFCGETILTQAKKCKHCGEFLVDELRKKADEQSNSASYNPIHHVQAFVRWFTGLGRLKDFRVSHLLSGALKRRSQEEIEMYFLCGGPVAPKLKTVPTEWPRPWFFWRLLVFGILVFIGFQFGMEHFQNLKLLPGLIIVGAFFVPLACGILFFEFNVLKNISLYQTIKYMMAGGILSLLAALFLFQFSGLNETFLGATSAGIVEETAKLLTAVVLIRSGAKKHWILNGMVVGAAVGVGFAGFETAGYIFETLLQGDSMHRTLFVRAVFAPFGHVVWTATTAGALWRVMEDRQFSIEALFEWKFLRVFAFVVLLHMFWNSGLLYSMEKHALVYGWIISILGSWYLALLITQEGLNQIETAKLREPVLTTE